MEPQVDGQLESTNWYNNKVSPMAKESIIAIVLGLVLGVIVALAAVLYTVNVQKKHNTQMKGNGSQSSASSTLVPESLPPTVTVLRSLEISDPKSGSTTSGKSIIIKGTAGSKTLIVIQSPVKTQVLNTEKDTFSVDFPLALGENVITVSAYHEEAVLPVQKKLYIYRLNP